MCGATNYPKMGSQNGFNPQSAVFFACRRLKLLFYLQFLKNMLLFSLVGFKKEFFTTGNVFFFFFPEASTNWKFSLGHDAGEPRH